MKTAEEFYKENEQSQELAEEISGASDKSVDALTDDELEMVAGGILFSGQTKQSDTPVEEDPADGNSFSDSLRLLGVQVGVGVAKTVVKIKKKY